MTTRYVYALFDLHKTELNRVSYALVAQVEIDVAGRELSRISGELSAWALTILKDRDVETGLYTAEFSTLDDDGLTDRCFYSIQLCWNGTDHFFMWPDRPSPQPAS